ncbi:SDR family NAD(P)-dependent oxidoreductase [Desulfatibacillum aliphaticivorans]|uniref:SDR family NAD(P)-dependent oxidoreductase n=1 Tax=Desulfatibacillum aliphaticivorans TaxID=218208 RepID=UPI0004146F4D|nr:SDR family oxidoreductase [Desulfatibacillum aliphaticivorans]
MSHFKDKVAIVTGAGSGIGKGLAQALAERGAKVVASDVNAERIAQVKKEFSAKGWECDSLALDVRDARAVKDMVDSAVEKFGRLDFLFNNAGIAIGGEAKDCELEDWQNVLDINLYGVVNGVAAAYPMMVEQGFGHIVNTASVEGLCPFPGTASYVASKYGVVGLSHSLRLEGAARGVKVSVICPGYIKTAIFDDSKLVGMTEYELGKVRPPEWIGITSEQCAEIVLKGVEKNKATIVVTKFAKILAAINRISPTLMQWMMIRSFKDALKKRAREELKRQQA